MCSQLYTYKHVAIRVVTLCVCDQCRTESILVSVCVQGCECVKCLAILVWKVCLSVCGPCGCVSLFLGVSMEREHPLQGVCVCASLPIPGNPTWVLPEARGLQCPFNAPPNPRHHLTSHAACQCCSERAHARTQANTQSPEPRKPPPGTLALPPPWAGVPGRLQPPPLLWGGPSGPGAGRSCNQGCCWERGGEGSPQPCWAGPGPSAAPLSTAQHPPPR